MKLNQFRISTRLLALALIGALFSTVIGVIGMTRVSQVNDMLNSLHDNNMVPITDLSNANMQAIYHNRSLHAYVIETDKAAMDKMEDTMKRRKANMESLLAQYRKTVLTPKEVELLGKFDSAWPAYLAAADRVRNASYTGDNALAVKLMTGEAATTFQAADDLLSALVDTNIALGKQVYDESDVVVTHTQRGMVVSIVVAAVLSIGLGLAIGHSITPAIRKVQANLGEVAKGNLAIRLDAQGRDETAAMMGSLGSMQEKLTRVIIEVRESSDAVAAASVQIAQGNRDLAARTEEQASALSETSASMEQLSATVKQNTDGAKRANELAMSASEVAVKGGAVVGLVVETMREINESSTKIADIIGVIEGIAFQTNILALNAAVEAARAGEQGRGFAVVASEVRSLAGRSAEAAKEIKGLISASVDRVAHGSELVDDAGVTMSRVVSAIKEATDIMGEISAASTEQIQGVNQVGQAVNQIDQATQENAALVEEMATAASSLSKRAQELVQTIAFFNLSGASDSAASPTAGTTLATPASPTAPPKGGTTTAAQPKKSGAPAGATTKAASKPAPAPAPTQKLANGANRGTSDGGAENWESF